MKENTQLWSQVDKTPAELVTHITMDDGTLLSSVPAINRIKRATEIFGIYGKNWGLKNLKHAEIRVSTNCLIATLDAVFYVNGGGYETEFEITNSVLIAGVAGGEFKINNGFRKDIETGAITKSLSRLGFNADIYSDAVKAEEGASVDLIEELDLIKIGARQ